MSLVFDTLRASNLAAELRDHEITSIAPLFDVIEYSPSAAIVRPGEERPDNLYLVAEGRIEVKFDADGGAPVLHTLKPGELAAMITFVGGSSSQVSATLYAIDHVKVLSLEQPKVEELIQTAPMTVYRLMRGLARSMQGIVHRGNSQTTQLSNYINQVNGRY
jgi:CRP-like cAMP-binding protein